MSAELKPSFRVSDRARARILALLGERASNARAVRLFAERTESGTIELGLSFDDRQPEDETLSADGLELVADRASVAAVEGRVLDYMESTDAGGFTLLTDGEKS